MPYFLFDKEGIALRGLFIIEKEGYIQYSTTNNSSTDILQIAKLYSHHSCYVKFRSNCSISGNVHGIHNLYIL